MGSPLGQPILVGHHSQGRAERDRARITAHFDASVQEQRAADADAAAAHTAAAGPGARRNPVTVANRIDRLSAKIRAAERALEAAVEAAEQREGAQGAEALREAIRTGQGLTGWAARMVRELEQAQADLQHAQEVREQQLRSGEAPGFGPATVAAGDAVKIRGSWYRVVRVNAKSVTVQTEHSWTSRSPWQEVREHRAAR